MPEDVLMIDYVQARRTYIPPFVSLLVPKILENLLEVPDQFLRPAIKAAYRATQTEENFLEQPTPMLEPDDPEEAAPYVQRMFDEQTKLLWRAPRGAPGFGEEVIDPFAKSSLLKGTGIIYQKLLDQDFALGSFYHGQRLAAERQRRYRERKKLAKQAGSSGSGSGGKPNRKKNRRSTSTSTSETVAASASIIPTPTDLPARTPTTSSQCVGSCVADYHWIDGCYLPREEAVQFYFPNGDLPPDFDAVYTSPNDPFYQTAEGQKIFAAAQAYTSAQRATPAASSPAIVSAPVDSVPESGSVAATSQPSPFAPDVPGGFPLPDELMPESMHAETPTSQSESTETPCTEVKFPKSSPVTDQKRGSCIYDAAAETPASPAKETAISTTQEGDTLESSATTENQSTVAASPATDTVRTEEPALSLPFFREDAEPFEIPKPTLDYWESVYSNIDVQSEIHMAQAWSFANPKKHKKDLKRFLNNWLRRCSQQAPKQINPKLVAACPSFLEKSLWLRLVRAIQETRHISPFGVPEARQIIHRYEAAQQQDCAAEQIEHLLHIRELRLRNFDAQITVETAVRWADGKEWVDDWKRFLHHWTGHGSPYRTDPIQLQTFYEQLKEWEAGGHPIGPLLRENIKANWKSLINPFAQKNQEYSLSESLQKETKRQSALPYIKVSQHAQRTIISEKVLTDELQGIVNLIVWDFSDVVCDFPIRSKIHYQELIDRCEQMHGISMHEYYADQLSDPVIESSHKTGAAPCNPYHL